MRLIVRLLSAVRRVLGRSGRQPKTSEPGQLAFASLVEDPGLLSRLPRDQARRLGGQAETYASLLLRDGGNASSASAAAVMRVVRQFMARDTLRGDGVEDMIASVLNRSPDGLAGLIRAIEGEGVQPNESTAELALDAVSLLGSDGLQRIGRSQGEVLMRAAARQVARHLRSEVRRPLPSAEGAEDPTRVLRIIEQTCRAWGTPPLPPAAITEDRRQWAGHLVELWRDATTCAEHAEGPPARLWEDARDGHAFGAVWLMPSVLVALVRAEAEQLARDARSAAAFVIRRPPLDVKSRAAVEAARAVMVSCGAGWADRLAEPETVALLNPARPSVVPVRASLA